MKFARFILFVAMLLLSTADLFASTIPIRFTAIVTPALSHPGEVVTVTVKATVDPGWHVYSVVPADNGPVATEIVPPAGAAALGLTTEDAPTSQFDPNFQRTVSFHEGSAVFTRQLRVTAPIQSITLHYQTCNDHVCLPPTDVALPIAMAVTPGAVRPEYDQAAAIASPVSSAKSTQGLTLFLLAALGAGLLALLTPCVFPLIPITLTSFVKQADGNQAKLVRLSGGYALGIVILYVTLGGVVTATLGATGISNLAANPWVNLGIFVVFAVFAFSFFETIQLTLPANLTALQATAKSQGGIIGLALLGISFVLASFTCTAPFLGTLLVSAAAGDRLRPLLGMLVFSLAFVSPFLLFAAFPKWISKIPKGGLWLARVKATLGFLELAAALKFLSNADLVWNWKLLTQPVLLAAWALIFVCAALYLWGTLRFGVVGELEKPGAKVPALRGAFAALFVFLALYCFWGLAGRPIGAIAAFLPPLGYGSPTGKLSEGLPWQSDYVGALAQAKAEGKLLFVDFTGVTCTNCRWNEKNVFPRAEVQDEFAHFTRVQLYTDRPGDAANQRLQLTHFGDVALPLYAVVDPESGTVIDKYAGTITSVSDFLRFLSHARTLAPGSANAAWAAYSPSAFTAAKQAGKPILIDFTAAWCVNCKEIEHDVFENPAVAPSLAAGFTTLRADLTQWNSPASVALQKQYGFGSLPTIILLDSSGDEIRNLRITGRISVAEFQERMRLAQNQPRVAPISVATNTLSQNNL